MTTAPTERKPEQSDDESVFIHIKPKQDCDHDFQGWREFEDGRGGERVCKKCGIGAMEHTLSKMISNTRLDELKAAAQAHREAAPEKSS